MRDLLIGLLIGVILGGMVAGYVGYNHGYAKAKAEGGFRIDLNGKPILETR